MTNETTNKMTLADHAEAWHSEKGEKVPLRETPEWNFMYEKWVEFAFGPEKEIKNEWRFIDGKFVKIA